MILIINKMEHYISCRDLISFPRFSKITQTNFYEETQFYSYLGMKKFDEKKSTCISTRLKENKDKDDEQ